MSRTTRFSEARRGALRVMAAGFLVFGVVAAMPGAAWSAPLDAPRDAGIVGERYDGLAVIRDEARADAALRSLVSDINEKRRAYYQEQSAQQNAPMEAVAKIYAQTIYDKAPSGWWFLQQDGSWARKP